jgi:hypothetical protein
LTQKQADFLLLKEIIELINAKSHLTLEGLQNIINLRAAMNKGLSEELANAFPNTEPASRPQIVFDKISHPCWLVGFTDGEGCFYVNVKKTKTTIGFQVLLVFSVSQDIRDELLLSKIIDYLGCGKLEKPAPRPSQVTFVVYKFSDIYEKIIPLFQEYPLRGVKYADYSDFNKIALLMKDKAHLTQEGIVQISLIKQGMNKGRTQS